jgi:hypothetical protein
MNTKNAVRIAAAVVILLAVATAGQAMMFGRGPRKPAAGEFGLGPRTAAQGRYVATLQPDQPLQVRKLQSVRFTVTDANGKAIDGATVAVDGGMPQHGHGLPTKPRARQLAEGVYEIQGLRFNMGGWWELRLAITTPSGTDTVTFNLAL